MKITITVEGETQTLERRYNYNLGTNYTEQIEEMVMAVQDVEDEINRDHTN